MERLILILELVSFGASLIGIIILSIKIIIQYRDKTKNSNIKKKKMPLNNSSYEDSKILFINYKDFPEITDVTRANNSIRIFTGGVRINSSKYRTNDEDKQYRDLSLEKELP